MELALAPQHTLHLCSDCGSELLPHQIWMYTFAQVFGTFNSDKIGHDLHNSVGLALSDAGLQILANELALVSNWTHGAFAGDGNLADLSGAAQDFFALADSSNDLFQLLYPAICFDFGERSADLIDDADHFERIFENASR